MQNGREQITKGKKLYYARIMDELGIYELIELTIRTVNDDYFVGIDSREKHSYLFGYNSLDKAVFFNKEKALDLVKAAADERIVSEPFYYEDYQ